MFHKQSSDNSFSWAVVTFEVAPHQERICPQGCHLALLLITEQEVSDTCQNTAWGGGHDAVYLVPGDTYQQQSGQNL